MLAGCLLWNVLLWLQGTSIFGTWARLWWEDTQWRHQAAWRSCLAANLVEVSCLLCTRPSGSCQPQLRATKVSSSLSAESCQSSGCKNAADTCRLCIAPAA